MSKKSDKNNEQPLDDLGIKNDQLISCAEKIVDNIWLKLNNQNSKDISAEDIHAYSATLCNVWSLVKNMMEFLEKSYDEELESHNKDDDDDHEDEEEDEDDEDEEEEKNDKDAI